MKTLLTFLFAGLLGLTTTTNVIVQKLTVDTNQSTAHWKGAKVTSSHEGLISIKDGVIELKNGALTGGNFTMDMTSITCTDLKEGGAKKLVGHLMSDDFFGVANHPTATLNITKVADAGAGTYDVTGDLTIKGQTHPVTFNTLVVQSDLGLSATAKIVVDRTLYGIKYGSGKFFDSLGDRMIKDEFELNVNLIASK